MDLDISIVICCYNSALRLPTTLRHIAAQKEGQFNFEIIIVDNGSKDNTVEIATNAISNLKLERQARIVYEANPGLSSARNKGVSESRGKYILFCDDDNWLSDDYLQIAYKILNSDQNIGMLGGIGTAEFEGIKPEWFDRFQNTYAVGPQHNEAGDISRIKAYVYGAGALVRKDALEILKTIGFQHVLTDRIGKKLVSGGDNEIGYALVLLGYKIYYTPELKFKHFIPKGRATIEYLSKVHSARAYTDDVVRSYEEFIFDGVLKYRPKKVSDTYRDLKKLLRVIVEKISGDKSFIDYFVRKKKLTEVLRYQLFYRELHKNNFAKVSRNIRLIEVYRRKHAIN